MVLVDTSVWIDFLRRGVSAQSRILADLISGERGIAICGLVRQEVLQGVRDEVTLRRVRTLLGQTHYLRLEEPQTFDQAAEIYRDLRRHGATLRSPMDCLIAAIAIHSQTPLLHRDRDFLTIARFSSLKLFED